MKDFQYVTNAHPGYIEQVYQEFLKDPDSIDQDMRKFFEGFDFAISSTGSLKVPDHAAVQSLMNGESAHQLAKELGVYRLIQDYRKKGHLIAKTNPIRERIDRQANLELSFFGLSDADLDTSFNSASFANLPKSFCTTSTFYLLSLVTHVDVLSIAFG